MPVNVKLRVYKLGFRAGGWRIPLDEPAKPWILKPKFFSVRLLYQTQGLFWIIILKIQNKPWVDKTWEVGLEFQV